MEKVFVAKAYAKVNFNLKVLPKREDGFHNIESIFQTVDLYDELRVRKTQNPGCQVVCKSIELPPKNTLTSAYQAFIEVAGCKVPGIEVELIKGIPSGGGLGGGSSDAAALIRVLEKMCGLKLSDMQLDYVASKTGSDVFFFMHCDKKGRGCALVSGRGEIIRKIKSRHDLYLLFVFPEISSSTKEAYALVDQLLTEENKIKCPEFGELESIYMKAPQNWTFNNTFTKALSNRYKQIGQILSELKRLGAPYSDMSGSGSTVFAVFTKKQQATYCSNLLADTLSWKIVQTI